MLSMRATRSQTRRVESVMMDESPIDLSADYECDEEQWAATMVEMGYGDELIDDRKPALISLIAPGFIYKSYWLTHDFI